MRLQVATNARSCAMQQHTLIAIGHTQQADNLVRVEAVHVAHHDDGALLFGQRVDCSGYFSQRLPSQEDFLGVL